MNRPLVFFPIMILAISMIGIFQSWSTAIFILNFGLISAVMALGVNIQWGYAGLLNVGIMGFTALGGVAAMLVSVPPVQAAWEAGGEQMMVAGFVLLLVIAAIYTARKFLPNGLKHIATAILIIGGYFLVRVFYDPASEAIEGVEAARFGFLGGLGLPSWLVELTGVGWLKVFPIVFSWIVGGIFAGCVAFLIGKIALGLRSDYLAIASLGISEIIVAILKNEDWLTRGVKNVSPLPRPVPYEFDLQSTDWFLSLCNSIGADPIAFSGIFVKLCYTGLFLTVVLILLWLSQNALSSPWGRMMRAIRDNRDAAEAMGKDVTRRHLQVFVLGSAVVGIGGAMMTTLDGQLTPAAYQPLRYTFLIWVMVIVGGSGNNYGAILGGLLVWFVWTEAEPAGLWLSDMVSYGFGETSIIAMRFAEAAPHLRLFVMGVILLLILRFSPRGLIPER